MRISQPSILAGVAGVVILALASVDTLAQEIEEITVTARRRSESLMTVPVAVSAVSSDELARSGAVDLTDLSGRVPGLHYSAQGGSVAGRYASALRFRGMDTNLWAPSQQLGTAFVDGVYVSEGVSSLDLSIVERVEVIRGPQSAQFGRSTFAGAVNYVTRAPRFDPHARASVELGQYGTRDVSLMLEGPVIPDRLAYLVSYRQFGTDGQYESTSDGGKLGKERTDSIMGQLMLRSGNFTARGWVHYTHDDDGPPAGVQLTGPGGNLGAGPHFANSNDYLGQAVDDAGLMPSPTSQYFIGDIGDIVKNAGYSWDQLTDLNTAIPQAARDLLCASAFVNNSITGNSIQKISGVPHMCSVGREADSVRAALILNYSFPDGFLGGHEISALTGWSDWRTNYVRDVDMRAALNWFGQDPQKYRNFSQEIRLISPQERRFRYVVGAQYFDVDYIRNGEGGYFTYDSQAAPGRTGANPEADPVLVALFGGSAAQVPGPPWQTVFGSFPRETGRTTAAFGSLSFDLASALTVDFEWRWQEDRVGQEPDLPGGVAYSQTFRNFLPRATVSWRPIPETTLWATYSKGNLPGAFNPTLANQPASVIEQVRAQVGEVGVFNQEEELDNYELGWRQRWLDDRLYTSIVAYRMDWTQLKTRVNVLANRPDGSAALLNITANLGNAKLSGFEFEGAWSISDRLDLGASINLAGGEYERFTCAFAHYVQGSVSGRVGCDGNHPARFPKWSGSLNSTYRVPVSAERAWYVRGDMIYTGKAYSEETNFSWIGDSVRVNARAGLEFNENWRFEIFARNLFDDDTPLAAARKTDTSQALIGDSTMRHALVVTPPEKRVVGVRVEASF